MQAIFRDYTLRTHAPTYKGVRYRFIPYSRERIVAVKGNSLEENFVSEAFKTIAMIF